MSNQREKKQNSQELNHLREEFEHWRQTRTKKGSIPEELWQQAAKLACESGPTFVAKQLGLAYGPLKRRMVELARKPSSEKDVMVPTRFVEYRQNTIPLCSEQAAGNSVTVELKDPSGYQLRLHVPSPSVATLDLCMQRLWAMRACCK